MCRSLLGVFVSFAVVGLFFGTAPAQPKRVAIRVTFEKPIGGAPLSDLLEFIQLKYKLGVQVDEEAFAKTGNKNVIDSNILLPRMTDIPINFVLEIIAHQAGGRLEEQNGQPVIVPGKRALTPNRHLRPAGEAIGKKLSQAVAVPTGFRDQRFEDVATFLSTKSGVTIVVADQAIRAKKITLAGETQSLQKWLELLARQVGGEVVVYDELVLIEPSRISS